MPSDWTNPGYNWYTNPQAAVARQAQMNAQHQSAFQRSGGGGTLSSAGSVPYGNLAIGTNALMTQQAKAPFVANLPDYESMVAQRSANTGAQLRGEVPQDVVNQLIQGAAERGILTGSPGSPNSNASYLKALGLTSIGQQQAGSQNLSQSIADTPVPQLFNPSSLFVPEHLAGMELSAAQAGLGAGRGMGGYGGGGSIGPPSLGFNLPNTPASWQRQDYQQGPAVGRTGYFADDQPGMFSSSTFSNGMYTGGGQPSRGQGQSYMGPSVGFGNPWDPINQPADYGFNEQYTGNDFLDELYSDFDNVDWGSDYSPFGP